MCTPAFNFTEDRFDKSGTKFLEVAVKQSKIVGDDLRVLVESA